MTECEVLAAADCEQVLMVRDRRAQATVLVAVHDTSLGPAHGGIRRWQYGAIEPALRDVLALATAMTWKCALAEIPAGGGKCVVLDHPGLDRAAAYRLVGRTVAELGGRYFTGPDVGTTDDDLRIVAEQTRFVARAAAGEGPGDLAAATAVGVLAAMSALLQQLGRPLAGAHVAVQGLGAVGMQLVERLAKAGARLSVSDVLPARTQAAAKAFGAAVVAPQDLVPTRCDVFAPCALGGVLTAAAVRELGARGVCGAANNIFGDAAVARLLHERGVPVVPDFVANAGALILGATWHLTGQRADGERVQRIGRTAAELLARASAEHRPPMDIAMDLARERVERVRR